MRQFFGRAGRSAAVAAFGIGAAVAAPHASGAQELSIGFGAAVTSMDPHFHNLGPNNMLALHVFDALVHQDEQQKLVPGLAESWKAIDDTTWEFKLRKGVKFHDGADFDAQDVVATVRRAPNVPNSPSSFKIYLSAVKDVVAVDPHTVRFVTAAPAPLVPNEISSISIVSRKAEAAASADFNAVKAAIGTGPFKLVEYVQGERVVYARNERYWGGQPSWAKVTYRIITNPGARVAALRAGYVQAITDVPTADIAGLKKLKELSVVSAPSNRVIYLHMDHQRDVTPFAFEKGAAKPLAKNPLKDLRVRKAMSMAINRQAIAERVMEGNG
ncbi:MAG: ABC transporter substrate-binding protein, partial [Alphaproteobacteria bacterium]|nr:ABC transporter substrate-binding protein [Alphaproteobacteria bacterium]